MWHDPKIWWVAAVMMATTVGAGIFGLPYLAARSGWLSLVIYLATLSGLMAFSHGLYLRIFSGNGSRHGLVGLVNREYGKWGRELAILTILGGLVLTLLAYLILVSHFLELIIPGWEWLGLMIFWAFGSLAILLQLKRLVASEIGGSLAILVLTALLFGLGLAAKRWDAPLVHWPDFLLPFGPVLFALAGWTAIEPIAEYAKKNGLSLKEAGRGMVMGTWLSAGMYALFAFAILAAAPVVTPDTLRGLGEWSPIRLLPVIILGMVAIWTSYVPIGLEIKRSLEEDLAWSRSWSALIVFGAPPALYLLGLQSFLAVIGLVGGVFLGWEYIWILLLSRRLLPLGAFQKKLATVLIGLFFLGALYEVMVFFN